MRDCDGFIVKVNEIQDYKEDDDIWYEEKTLKGTWKSMVVKHSPNIIDLIEVGDTVRILLNEKTGETTLFSFESQKQIDILNKDNCRRIKSIVTKEQFESIEYRVE